MRLKKLQNRNILAMFSPLILHCKISGERACARVKKLPLLLRLNLNRRSRMDKKAFLTALGALCLAVVMWGMSPDVSFRTD